MRVFLSHKMSGLTEGEVIKIREHAKLYLESRYGAIEIVDNYFHDGAPESACRLWHLGASIQMMSNVDAIYFCPGWEEANGCKVERVICNLYRLNVID